MIITAIELIYAILICYLAGYLVRKGLHKTTGYTVHSLSGVIVSGFAAINLYAQIWNFFAPVNIVALAVLTILLGITAGIFYKEHKEYLSGIFKEIPGERYLLLLLLFAGIAVLSASEPKDWDTYLYHAQAVKWIENYHVIPGLANLHNRFGYNSALMTMHALLSLAFTGHPTHIVNGLMALIMLGCSLSRIADMIRHGIRRSVLFWLGTIFYSVHAISSISSLGTDIVPMLLLLYIFGIWCDEWDQGNRGAAAYGSLALLGVYDITVKLSVAPLTLLCVLVVIWLFREKKGGVIAVYAVASLINVIPFLLRNIIITGYLVYPMESIDLFNVDWKVPAEVSRLDRAEIVAYGRELHDDVAASMNAGFTEWFQRWFLRIDMIPRVLLLLTGIFVIVDIVLIIRKRLKGMDLFIFVSGILCMIYWLTSSPLVRYGIVTIIIGFAAASMMAFKKEGEIRVLALFFCFLIFLIIPVKINTDVLTENENLIWASGYYQYECETVELTAPDGTKYGIYRPIEGDQGGYDLFPEAPYIDVQYIRMRGNDFSDGFMAIKNGEGQQ